MVVYGGDEVNAFVIDCGSYETKAGYAGKDCPDFVFDSNQQEHVELVAKAFKLARIDPQEHPLIIVDSGYSSEEKQKLAEFCFELKVPAIYFGQEAILVALVLNKTRFAAGKSTALVVSSGHSGTMVSPVYDGYVLQKGTYKQALAGKMLSEHAIAILKNRNISVVPQCQIASKSRVDADKPAVFEVKNANMTEEQVYAHVLKAIHDWKETLCQTLEVPFDPSIVMSRPVKPYEFPNGFNALFQAERYSVPEAMFNPKVLQPAPEKPMIPLSNLVHGSLQQVDPDIRPQLYQSIVLAGGNTLIPGFPERLQNEMNSLSPGVRCKIFAAGHSSERKWAAWLGGSILASLGTFHQLWISSAEYAEQGASVLDKR